jgi:hypothetical protein
MEQPTSMSNPNIITFPHLNIGSVFIFKGHRCKVTKMDHSGFTYDVEHPNHNYPVMGWMSYSHYMSTPSAKGRGL